MHWFAVMAVGATVGLVKKLIVRHLHGTEVPRILEDPPEVRTLARFRLDHAARARDVLRTVASALAPDVGGWVATDDVVSARPPGNPHDVDVLRLVHRGSDVYTIELTRAWTGADLGQPTRALLVRMHRALAGHDAVRELGWHWRQDRALAVAHPYPVAAMSPAAPATAPTPTPVAG